MTQIKQLKDTHGNFYPVTHKDAIVGLEDIQVDMPKLDNTNTKQNVINKNDGTYYFTTDTKQIYRNGESYGGNITTEDVETFTEEGITVQAAIFVQDYVLDSNSSFTIKPNYKYMFGERSVLTISLEPITDYTIVNHYMFEFTSGSTATTLSLPASIKWTTEPSIKPNKIYQISIENNLGVIQEWT